MSQSHICNSFFEMELQSSSKKALAHWMRSHPIVMQLQFLPLLYAGPDDAILVSDLPENPDPRLCLLDHPTKFPIDDWGPSLAIADWAKRHQLPYLIPNWEIIRTINSKVFSFTESPKLPGAKLLTTQEEIEEWIQSTPDPKILKTPFGTAGRGHLVPNVKQLYKPPLIGEPWVERVMDFSTQWKNGRLLGITLFENRPNGAYKATFAGEVEAWALDEHLKIAEPLIKKIGQFGYSGHIGIDAFIYLRRRERRVHPVVEINARKTMSWVALQLPKKRLILVESEKGLLPTHLGTARFSKNIVI